ncbi:MULTISPECIES: flagellar biosynthetic protein FliR [unclassified Campylobacter]|uniref:flagellar biosynthetic protein FliR n=1 Tax=unclassified Campylobacter TaxID=2593542 RepID=UPI001BD92232|nr:MULTISPECIES: flagellar biosynthetic protein FliR [unclassified Campylobacter]MBZ7975288.1 flagellar type III secretion system protein FliR [Campylobacter sp. RM12637]MBZ7978382.1 flagellar type III secretion system protein FliR [Campylobacter sp. RM12654]MBZ7981640.1 flagellar type III secretion system protein FliR [Campylobacter sp. RM12640]MBZ7984361.1 flagellar type III secretion system protein FliR [Campylobacter sp. RM12647]MBZ7988518.1 flagellar type III secretion system protein FliR
MELVRLFSEQNIVLFMLLLARMSGLCLFFPFYSHLQIPVVIKSSFVIIMTFFFYPLAHTNITPNYLVIALITELLLGLVAGLCLQLTFTILQMSGEHISFIMGFSMASVLDPNTGANTPIIGHFISLIALLLFLAYDGHHLVLLFWAKSLNGIALGDFALHDGWFRQIMNETKDIYLIGLSLAFPIIAISMLSDFVFGLLMKTMPQFNLLVVGYPIKITIAFIVLMTILATILFYFKELVLKVFLQLELFVS